MPLTDLYKEEPKPLDLTNPVVQDEVFGSLKFSGVKPEDLITPSDGRLYREWLDKNEK